jgi:DNA-binding CsgD family transcriptional regulator
MLFPDTSANLTISQIVEKYANGQFQNPDKTLLLDPFKTYWVRFELYNNCPGELMWMLHLNTQISHVWSYPFAETANDIKTIPADSSISVIYISDNRIMLPVYYKARNIYYIKLVNHLNVPTDVHKMYLSPVPGYRHYWLTHGLFIGFVLGGLFVMMLYGLISFLKTPKKLHFYYFFYTLFVGAFLIMVSFIGEQYIFKNNPWLSFKSNILLLIAFMFYFPFIRKMSVNELNIKTDRWIFRPFIIFMLINSTIVSVIAFINEPLFYQVYNYTLLIYSIFAIFLVFALWRTNRKTGRTILLGMVIMVTGGSLSVIFGLLDNIEENHYYNIGVYVELIVFTYAMIQLKNEIEKDNTRKEFALLDSKNKIEIKQRELAQKALHIAQQEEILIKIKTQLQDIKGEKAQTNETLLSVLGDIDLYLKQNSWDDFERYFIEVHPNFYRDLKALYPELTQMELRVCAMLKLNLNTKQMADISRKTPKSVDVTRTRIRQKMRLTRDENLFDKLSSI